MFSKRLKKRLLVTGRWLLTTGILIPSPAGAGWLLWEAPKEVLAPAGEKMVPSVKEPAESLPEFAFSPSGKEKIPVNLFFSAGLSGLRSFAAENGWAECETKFVGSAGQALKSLYSGRELSSFMPAKRWLFATKPQDVSFCGRRNRGFETYFWRLPFRDPAGTPFWAAAVSGRDARKLFDTALKTSKTKSSKIKNARSKNEAFLISFR